MKRLHAMKVFYSKEDKGWIAMAPELKGCSAFGDTPEEALKELERAIEGWAAVAQDMGWRIPKPAAARFSGKATGRLLLRIPKRLHHELVKEAASEGVSLNQLMLYKLASGGESHVA